jgi:hypothetical protein
VIRVDRKEARLMTLAEWEQTGGSRTPGAESQLVWVVGLWGEYEVMPPFNAPPYRVPSFKGRFLAVTRKE